MTSQCNYRPGYTLQLDLLTKTLEILNSQNELVQLQTKMYQMELYIHELVLLTEPLEIQSSQGIQENQGGHQHSSSSLSMNIHPRIPQYHQEIYVVWNWTSCSHTSPSKLPRRIRRTRIPRIPDDIFNHSLNIFLCKRFYFIIGCC